MFVGDWGQHGECGVSALAVVARLDVLGHGGLQLEPRWPGAAVDELFSSVATNVSTTALSNASPREPIKTAIPASPAALPNARLTYELPWSEW